jgi:hypothetical protein
MPRKANPRAGDAGARTLQTSTADTNNQIAPAKQEPPSYVLTLPPLPDCRDPMRQVRWLLKRALRDHGLRCVSAEIRPPPEYDPERDAWEGVSEAYRVIRRRKAAGGKGWKPSTDKKR